MRRGKYTAAQHWFGQGGWVFVLLLLMAVPLTLLASSSVRISPDSKGYLLHGDVTLGNLKTFLAADRTLGYPLLEHVVSTLSGGRLPMPVMHMWVFLLGVATFIFGLFQLRFRPLAAALAGLPLALSQMVLEYVHFIHTDVVGLGFAVGAMGMVMAVVGNPRRLGRWVVLALLVTLSYQMRPAYLLVPLLTPPLGLLLWKMTHEKKDTPPLAAALALLKPLSVFVLAAMGPLVAFIIFRGVVVGHFALTSFGNVNLLIITSQLYQDTDESGLPPAVRGWGKIISEARQEGAQQHLNCVLPSFDSLEEKNRCGVLMIKKLVWKDLLERPEGFALMKLDKQAGVFSRFILKKHAKQYLSNVSSFFWQGVYSSLHQNRMLQLALAALAGSFFLQVLFHSTHPMQRNRQSTFEVAALGVLATAFYISNLVMVALVEVPLDRYTYAGAVFMPGYLLLLAAGPWLKTSGANSQPEQH